MKKTWKERIFGVRSHSDNKNDPQFATDEEVKKAAHYVGGRFGTVIERLSKR